MRVAVLAVVLGLSSTAAAQAGTLSVDAETTLANDLADLRLRYRDDRAAQGWALIPWGGASVATGAVLTGIGASDGDERLLWAGLGTLTWGALNMLFSLIMFDLDGSVTRDIEAERSARGSDLVIAREDAARDQWSTATVIAVNAGLDVFYVATGILMALIGETAGPDSNIYDARDELIGYGAAMAAQGGGLLIYDVVCWLLSQDRGDTLMRFGR